MAKQYGATLLKVIGILLTIWGFVLFISCGLTLIALPSLEEIPEFVAAFSDSGLTMDILWIILIQVAIGSLVNIFAGIVAILFGRKAKHFSLTCIASGLMIIWFVANEFLEVSITGTTIGGVLADSVFPILYLIGVLMNCHYFRKYKLFEQEETS